eukprot:1143450-Alexandrium_andersonii.AAC.1
MCCGLPSAVLAELVGAPCVEVQNRSYDGTLRRDLARVHLSKLIHQRSMLLNLTGGAKAANAQGPTTLSVYLSQLGTHACCLAKLPNVPSF